MKQVSLTADHETDPRGAGWGRDSFCPESCRGNTSGPQVKSSLARPKTILIADDDASVRQMLGRVLELEHYTVVSAQTGREAAAIFLSAPLDLVLLDLNMPEKDGWVAFHLMHAVNPLIPVIIITARPGQQEPAARMGADALMEKPLDLSILLRTVARFLAETAVERTQRLARPHFETPYPNQHLRGA